MINKVTHGDCLDVLKTMDDNSVDSVVTDPPYGLSKEPDISEVLKKWLNGDPYDHKHGGFMGKKWDSFVPHPDIWKEVFRVLKPGGHALVFAGTRTQDLMTISLRLAGFEVRDVIEWLYFSGFPKSFDVSKGFDRRAGAERKKIGEYIHPRDNVAYDGKKNGRHFSINASGRDDLTKSLQITAPATDLAKQWDGWGTNLKPAHEPIIMVRKPLHDGRRKIGTMDCVEKYGTGAINIDACRIGDGSDRSAGGLRKEHHAENMTSIAPHTKDQTERPSGGRFPANCITLDSNEFYSKYFNISPKELSKKASKKNRNSDWQGNEIKGNNHPTVKPTDLMAWLIKLVTPPNGVVLDPFAGSGSTLVAAKREGFNFLGIEMEDEYIPIIEARTGTDE